MSEPSLRVALADAIEQAHDANGYEAWPEMADAALSVIQERLAQEDNPDEWWVYDGMCCIWCGGTAQKVGAAHQPGCALADLLGSR